MVSWTEEGAPVRESGLNFDDQWQVGSAGPVLASNGDGIDNLRTHL